MTVTEQFADYIYGVRLSPDDRELTQVIESRILDYIAVTCSASYYSSDIAPVITRYADSLNPGAPKPYPVGVQAFINKPESMSVLLQTIEEAIAA